MASLATSEDPDEISIGFALFAKTKNIFRETNSILI